MIAGRTGKTGFKNTKVNDFLSTVTAKGAIIKFLYGWGRLA